MPLPNSACLKSFFCNRLQHSSVILGNSQETLDNSWESDCVHAGFYVSASWKDEPEEHAWHQKWSYNAAWKVSSLHGNKALYTFNGKSTLSQSKTWFAQATSRTTPSSSTNLGFHQKLRNSNWCENMTMRGKIDSKPRCQSHWNPWSQSKAPHSMRKKEKRKNQ